VKKELIDDLDLRILRCLGEGIYSYNEIAKACGVSRNTVYRRISRLEETGVIRKKLAAVINYKKLNYSVVIIGIKLASIESLDKAVSFLKVQHNVKFIWKTYGDHDLIVVIFCDKETVGECIHNFKKALEKLGVSSSKYDISVSISWEKMDLSP